MSCIELITTDQLESLINSRKRANKFVVHLNETLSAYQINTRLRIAAFMGQVIHESGSFRYTEEIASGAAYEGRRDLGNTHPGDGTLFKGRGLIQITGRYNYQECSEVLFGDDRLTQNPGLLSEPHNACMSAGWYWDSRGLNTLADNEQYKSITKRINGGLNGLKDRELFYRKVLALLR